MTKVRTERRLAAIVAADVVGYSRLVCADESDALKRLGTLRRNIIEPSIASYSGRLFKVMGDGFLAEFASAVQAVSCALAIQTETEAAASGLDDTQKMRLRIGIHVGDVMVEGEDLLGDGINIAARLESIAAAGGISISRAVHDQVRDRIKIAFDDEGEVALKNIARPVHVFSLVGAASAVVTPSVVALPDKPSIAVLPFENMSGDPEQGYFADGMVEEIITALSRFRSLFVIARNSSFTYKGKAVDIKQVGRELGVRYVLEGSVRNAARKVRITGQLIDTATGAHLWADKFDGQVDDIFALQDEITEKVVAAIEPRLQLAEIELAARRRPDNFSAYDLYLRALPLYYTTTKEGLATAIRLLSRALELDPRFGSAALLAAWCRFHNLIQGGASDLKSEADEALRLARLALAIDPNDPETLCAVGRMTSYFTTDYETAIDLVNQSVALNPNLASSWGRRGWTYLSAGVNPEEAMRSFERCVRVSPLDPTLYIFVTGMAVALIELGRFEEAVATANRALRQNHTYSVTYRCLAAALAQLGRQAEAGEAAARLLELHPGFRISEWTRGVPGQIKSKAFVDGLRLAGLPE